MGNLSKHLYELRERFNGMCRETNPDVVISKVFYHDIRNSFFADGVLAAGEVDTWMQYWFIRGDDYYKITIYMFQCMELLVYEFNKGTDGIRHNRNGLTRYFIEAKVNDANNLKLKKDEKMQEPTIEQVSFKAQISKYTKDISEQAIGACGSEAIAKAAHELVDLALIRLANCAHTGCAGVIVGLRYVHAPKNKDIREAFVKRAVGLFKEDGHCRAEMKMKNGKPYIHVYYPEGNDAGVV